MKEKRYRFASFSFYDRTGIEAYLEKEAQKGWLLDKIGSFGWRFRRMEPKEVHFSVNYFPKASAFDPEPSEPQVRFQEFCEHTGWKLAGASAQLQIFYNEAKNPVPIETDALLEVETIHKAVKKGYLPSYLILLACGLMQMAMFFWRFSMDPLGVMCSAANLFTGFCWIMMLLIVLVEMLGYYRWYRKAKAAAKLDGSKIPTNGHTGFMYTATAIMLLGLGFTILSLDGIFIGIVAGFTIFMALGIVVVVLGFSKWMKKKKVSAKVNSFVTFASAIVLAFVLTGGVVFVILTNLEALDKEPVETYKYQGYTVEVYHDELPLKVEDLMEVDYDKYSYEWKEEKSCFLARYEADQRPRMDAKDELALEYTILEVKLPLLYNWCKNALLDEISRNYVYSEEDKEYIDVVALDADAWGAKEAYQLRAWSAFKTRYLICYEKCIIDISADWEMTKEQMAIVGKTCREF